MQSDDPSTYQTFSKIALTSTISFASARTTFEDGVLSQGDLIVIQAQSNQPLLLHGIYFQELDLPDPCNTFSLTVTISSILLLMSCAQEMSHYRLQLSTLAKSLDISRIVSRSSEVLHFAQTENIRDEFCQMYLAPGPLTCVLLSKYLYEH